MRDGGQIPPIMDEKGRSGVEQHDIVSNHAIWCRTTRYRLVRRDIMSNESISRCSTRCSGPVVQDATRHHAGASWTLTTTTPATTDLPPPFFLINQRQRDGCDDLPVARRSSGKKGGGGRLVIESSVVDSIRTASTRSLTALMSNPYAQAHESRGHDDQQTGVR